MGAVMAYYYSSYYLRNKWQKGFYEYNLNSIFMYFIDSIIYILIPTTTTPRDFIDGTIQTLSPNAMFYSTIEAM